MTDTVESIMALANAYKIARLPGLNAKAELRAAVERIVRSLSAWEQVWEGIRDNHEPNLNPTNKPLAVAATFQLAISRAERAEAECERLRKLMKRARYFVKNENDACIIACPEDPNYCCADTLTAIDAALAQGVSK